MRTIRTIAIAAAAAVSVLASTPAPARAGTEAQTEKCEDLLTRCQHRENEVCVAWQQECGPHRQVERTTHGPKKEHLGHKKHMF